MLLITCWSEPNLLFIIFIGKYNMKRNMYVHGLLYIKKIIHFNRSFNAHTIGLNYDKVAW